MRIEEHIINDIKVAEVISSSLVIENINSGTDLIGNLYYQGFENAIIHEQNIAPRFFDLKTGMAGEILQKFTNYRLRLAIVGDFANASGSLKDFITESNKGKHVNFVSTVDEALIRFSSR